MASFKDLALKPELLQSLQDLNFTAPTPIQESAIPALLQGQDVAGQAETGSGKTAAFGLPILHNIDTNLQQVQALVIVPTRELAVQVRLELKQLGKNIENLKISAFYGGHAFSQERASLAHPPQVLIGTPGRLTDHLNRRTLDLNYTKQVVLDEGDKLLEMGFEEEIDQVIGSLPGRRQTILFSATMPEGVKALIANSLRNPQFIQATATTIPDQVKLIGIKVEHDQRQEVVSKLLHSMEAGGTVVFVNTRATADELTAKLQAQGLSARALHGGMEQPDRDKAMTLFRNGSTRILVATDLAARGLDIDVLQNIIHVELPDDAAAYLHRSGRTGRAGKDGTVYTVITSRDEQKLREWNLQQVDEWLPVNALVKSSAKPSAANAAAFATIYINGGRKDKISPKDIVGALIAEAGMKADQIGKIEVQDRQSFVAVPASAVKPVIESLNSGKIKGRKFKVGLVK
ncbi:DEAD/DEAH box helicase [Pontibacter pamirensis]|uniref:DEAD/DEAH box helicase n=1 Tax=Pontibacter pamirensis TaxID=2562824 RepID=UPI00138A1D6C|nr:DEAD/DEAH box helicase [Pontibacter pamirensis]